MTTAEGDLNCRMIDYFQDFTYCKYGSLLAPLITNSYNDKY